MAKFTRSQKLLASASATAIGGSALLVLLAGNVATVFGAGATAVDVPSLFAGPDFPVCHTSVATSVPKMLLRFAQTEVSRAEMTAANSTATFADTEPPLWDGLGSIAYKITTATNARRLISIRACV